MLQKRHVLGFLESLAGEALQPVDLAVTVCHVPAHADLKPLLEVGEVDVVVQAIVVQLIEDGTPHLIGFQSDPVEGRKFVLCLDLNAFREKQYDCMKCYNDNNLPGSRLNEQE